MIALFLAAALAREFPAPAPNSVTLSYGGILSDLGETYIDLDTGKLLAARRRRGDEDRYSKEPLNPKFEKQLSASEVQRLRGLTQRVLDIGPEKPPRSAGCQPEAHFVWGIELHLGERSLQKDFVFCANPDADALRQAIYDAETAE